MVNADDLNYEVFADAIPNSTIYGVKAGQLCAKDVKLTPDGSKYQAVIGDDKYNITCHILVNLMFIIVWRQWLWVLSLV